MPRDDKEGYVHGYSSKETDSERKEHSAHLKQDFQELMKQVFKSYFKSANKDAKQLTLPNDLSRFSDNKELKEIYPLMKAYYKYTCEGIANSAKPKEIIDNASLVDDLGADSLDTVELIMAFEDAFKDELNGGEIPEAEAEKLQTVGDVLNYIKAKAGATA